MNGYSYYPFTLNEEPFTHPSPIPSPLLFPNYQAIDIIKVNGEGRLKPNYPFPCRSTGLDWFGHGSSAFFIIIMCGYSNKVFIFVASSIVGRITILYN